MDIDRIFGLFSPKVEGDVESSVLDIYEHPAYKMGMFKKWVSNIPNILKFSISHAKPGVEVEYVKDFIINQVYRKAFEYLEEINFEKHKQIIQNNLDPKFKFALEACINHFIYTEEYEKCTVLKKFQDLYQENVPT